MNPTKIAKYFVVANEKLTKDCILTEGNISCCNMSNFHVRVKGNVKYGLISKMRLVQQSGRIAIDAECVICNNAIRVFDSLYDGLGGKKDYLDSCSFTNPVYCKKCECNDFSITVKYEYSGIEEIKELSLSEINNAYSWIWVTLKCNNCGEIYKNFVNFETD